jgi:hypothetical protein
MSFLTIILLEKQSSKYGQKNKHCRQLFTHYSGGQFYGEPGGNFVADAT